MAVQTRPRLFDYFDSLRRLLVRQHISMPPVFAVIYGKGITFKNLAPTWVFFKFLEGLTPAMSGSLCINCPSIPIILTREILAPDNGVDCVFRYFYDSKHLLSCLFFSLRDVFQQKHNAYCCSRNNDNC